MTLRRIILSGGLLAAMALSAGDAMAQNYRSRFPTRPATPAPRSNPGVVTPFASSFANPNFSNVSPAVNANAPSYSGHTPFANPGFNNFNNFNNGYNNFTPYANPYYGNGFGTPFNQGFYPGVNPFANPFNPYLGNGLYNPYLGY